MLADGMLDQRHGGPHGGLVPLGRGIPPVAGQPRRELGQRAEVVMGLGRAIQRVADEILDLAGEGIGIDRGALDDPRIAEAGAFAGRALVDQSDRAPGLLQLQGRRQPDDARTQNHDVALHDVFILRHEKRQRYSWTKLRNRARRFEEDFIIFRENEEDNFLFLLVFIVLSSASKSRGPGRR